MFLIAGGSEQSIFVRLKLFSTTKPARSRGGSRIWVWRFARLAWRSDDVHWQDGGGDVHLNFWNACSQHGGEILVCPNVVDAVVGPSAGGERSSGQCVHGTP